MNAEILVLRIVHILGAIIWVGTSIFIGVFLMPALATVGPTGGAVIAGLAKRKLFAVVPIVALLNMLAGLRMMQIAAAGNWGAYFATRSGMTYLVGAVCALAAFVIFMAVSHRAMHRAMELGPRMAQASEAEQKTISAELATLRARGATAGAISMLLLIATVFTMAIGRYM